MSDKSTEKLSEDLKDFLVSAKRLFSGAQHLVVKMATNKVTNFRDDFSKILSEENVFNRMLQRRYSFLIKGGLSSQEAREVVAKTVEKYLDALDS